MTFNWNPNPALDKVAEELLKNEGFISPETLEYLQKNPEKYKTFCFSLSDIHGGGSSGSLNVTFDLLLQVGNPAARKALFVDYGPRLSAMFCSESLRFQFGMLDKTPPSFADDWDYFSDEYMEGTKYGRGEKVLTPAAKSIEEYVTRDLEIKAYYLYTSPHYHILIKGEKVYEGDDIEEFCETLYKELIK